MASIVKVEATINGQTYNLSKGSGDEWTATPSAPTQTSGSNNGGQGPGVGSEAKGKGYYPVVIRVTDDYGNVSEFGTDDPTWGSVLKLKVMERNAPVATLLYPNDGAVIKSAKPTVKFNVKDVGSGPKPTECYISIDDQPAIKITGIVEGDTCSVNYIVPNNLDDGAHTLKAWGYDYDENKSNEVSSTFTIDTTPPVLNVTNPASETTKTNKTTIKIVGTTNDEVSSPVTVKITGGVREYNPEVIGDTFVQDVELNENVTNTLTITATDSAGLSSSVTRIVLVNTIPPTIDNIKLTPNPVDGGKTLAISITARSA